MQCIYGYGVDLSVISHFTLERFFHFLKENHGYTDTCIQDLVEAGLIHDDEDYESYLEVYESSTGQCGISAFVKDVINEIEGLELECYDEIVNGCVFVPERFPWDFNAKMRSLSNQEYDEIFRKYISMLTDEEIVIQRFVMYEQ